MSIVNKNKKASRIRRAGRTRHAIRRLGETRLVVFRSSNNIYAQVMSPCGEKVLAAASTLDKDIQSTCKYCGNTAAAKLTGALLAKRCKAAGIDKLAFDRSGYRYHGRIKALAEAVREGGLAF